MTDVFISYSHKDIAFTRLLHETLRDNELETVFTLPICLKKPEGMMKNTRARY